MQLFIIPSKCVSIYKYLSFASNFSNIILSNTAGTSILTCHIPHTDFNTFHTFIHYIDRITIAPGCRLSSDVVVNPATIYNFEIVIPFPSDARRGFALLQTFVFRKMFDIVSTWIKLAFSTYNSGATALSNQLLKFQNDCKLRKCEIVLKYFKFTCHANDCVFVPLVHFCITVFQIAFFIR